MAEFIDFPQANHTWDPPPGASEKIHSLRTWTIQRADGAIQSMSVWRLGPDEMLEVIRTGCVYLFILGQHNPCFVTGTSPFPAEDDPDARVAG
jgi:hypothetical protein